MSTPGAAVGGIQRIGPFALHKRLDTYLCALRDPAEIPVFGARPAALDAVVGMTAPSSAAPPDVASLSVVTPSGSPAAALGRALATRFGGTAVEAPGDELTGAVARHAEADHLAVVTLSDEIDIDAVVRILDLLGDRRQRRYPTPDIGFLSAPTLEQLSWLVAKGLAAHLRSVPHRPHLYVAPREYRSAAHSTVDWAVGERTADAALRPVLYEQHNGVVSFASAGREHVIMLADTVVCGADPGRRPLPDGPFDAPHCAFTGRCFTNDLPVRDVIVASRVRADVVFTNVCMAWRVGTGLIGPEYQLTNGFLRGTPAAYIGPVYPVRGHLALNDLVHGAAPATSVGKICWLINDYVRGTGEELSAFAVLGLPWVAATRPAPAGARSGGPAGAAARHEAEEAAREVRRLGPVIDALRDLALLGFVSPRCQRDLRNVDARLVTVAEAVRRARFTRFDGLPDRLERLRDAVAAAELTVAEELHEYGKTSYSSFNELWDRALKTSIVAVTERCPHCRRRLARLDGEHLAHERVRRSVLICATCGPVLDLPTAPFVDDVVVHCPDRWSVPSQVRIDVIATPVPGLRNRVDGAAGIHLSGANHTGIAVAGPRRVALTPGKEVRWHADIELTAATFPHHQHFVRAVLVVGGQVHYASRRVAVAPGEPAA